MWWLVSLCLQCVLLDDLQQIGTIHAAAFSDANLYAEVANKAFFWMQPSFYNIDLTCLHKDAAAGYFTQVCTHIALPFTCHCRIVPPSMLFAPCAFLQELNSFSSKASS